MNIEKALILGLNGGFGKLFSQLLSEEGISIFGIDLASQPDILSKCSNYLCSDLSQPDKNALALATEVDLLLICLPESVAFTALEYFVQVMPTNGLVVDTLSVKTPVAQKMANTRTDVQLLSINPMFAPDLGFYKNNVAAIDLRPGLRSASFISLMEKWGANVTVMTASEHDRYTAITQVLTHASIISFGLCLTKLGYETDKVLSVSTPVHRTMLTLFARIASKDPEIYWRIQLDNPYAKQAREALIESLEQLELLTCVNHQQEFCRILSTNKESLSPFLDELVADFSRILKS
ncbi:MAG: prephenate dehydrogenase/arogenate dehydrogenase family protein [Symploca sp. SIO3C6]|uniref:Prephenate dehydrogenase/arogenate dehydrogenase family protein n=1 Tax=Symploca sp. SIO1C4 TaxID=2607765 RepID=A0A6B3N5L3_9CYAN|nr:prephenate dehydrogenase/arogenate dehydrogenase family protein [Symploca sp. SIO3C6]NER29036.1 prephenate dehydrogenase/arogenate dehydrogenase family protein [Symploca sp. SIO1C4]